MKRIFHINTTGKISTILAIIVSFLLTVNTYLFISNLSCLHFIFPIFTISFSFILLYEEINELKETIENEL